VELAEIAARAAGENFPVGSVLFPRPLRPHIRALYCYARLVDELGDAYEGDRLAALDELEREVDAALVGNATWPVLRNVQPTIREFHLPREPFLRLIEANRMDQQVTEYATWADLQHYCVHSADPCGRLVLGVLRRLDDQELVAASDSVCTGLQLVNFLQDVPRDLELGRIYLPADDRHTFGDPPLDRSTEELRALLRFEAQRAAELLAAGELLRERIGGRLGRAVALFSRGGLAALDALESAGWDIFSGRPRPSRARPPPPPGRARARAMSVQEAYAEVGRITRREAKNFAYGIMVLPRAKRQAIAAIYAFARRVDDVADGELPLQEKRAELEELRAALNEDPADPVFVALRDARERFGIPREPLEALIDGGLQDTEQATYADFAELRGYCEKVAGAVGLACVPVYGSDDTEHAMTLGVALQLINIIRDVGEDRQLGRVYLPQDELAAFEVEELAPSPQFRELMAFEAERARAHLAEGLRLLDSLDRRSALCVGTFAGLYRETLDRIEAGGFDVFGEKTRLSTPRKLAVVARGLLP
jgi:15-cis-phytoene synthase